MICGSKVYLYVVARDFGFAPNPFHGFCTLACCKPRIRSVAQVGDWVFGIGGSGLKASGQCIFGMNVTETLSFDSYWSDPRFQAKKPVRNGSRSMMLGDNIYHRRCESSLWSQENSHHSHSDGTPDISNVEADTKSNRVLISDRFVYFGLKAPKIPNDILDQIGYKNARNHRTFSAITADPLIKWFEVVSKNNVGLVLGEPFQFRQSAARYSSASNKIIINL